MRDSRIDEMMRKSDERAKVIIATKCPRYTETFRETALPRTTNRRPMKVDGTISTASILRVSATTGRGGRPAARRLRQAIDLSLFRRKEIRAWQSATVTITHRNYGQPDAGNPHCMAADH